LVDQVVRRPVAGPVHRFATPLETPKQVFVQDQGGRAGHDPAEATRILIVEDDFLVAMQTEFALSDAGFEIAGIASTAEDALELAASQRPTLVLMDIRLASKRDGVDAALELFRLYGLRCIFATAHSDREVRSRAEPASPLGWLQKPYTMANLLELVRNAAAHL
jgi:DNA-binding NarL/FixJ family response regulator